MTARKKALTAKPVLDGASDAVRVRVRVKPGGPDKRYRAGLGPFGAQPVEVAVSAEQRALLEADAWLEVEVLP